MKLSIIIVNYNVQYFLENCLNSVFNASAGIDMEVIVVDNNSVDGSLKMLAEKFPQVKLIANKDNKGFSKANNQAISVATGDLVLLLNPDTVVEENTFKLCSDHFEKHSDTGGLGVRMLDGKGNFLPESKRGLPTPKVAFYKIFGLSTLFPKSKRFGQYHLGHLSKDKNHEIEILSGAFMMIRKAVLDQIGLLDESFFMYGEDIDLSYRITQAGYKNYYLADTSIIHYKGESTKKSSINYVFVFYRAMAIFAKKHFSNKNAQLFSSLINIAIYLRAALAVLTRTINHFVLPVIDAVILFIGIRFFVNYYDNIKFDSGGTYPEEVITFGIPILTLLYLISLLLNGAYAIPTAFKNALRGIFSGSLVVLITYSLLSEDYRFSRAVILFSVIWASISLPLSRYALHLVGLRKFKKDRTQRIAIVGMADELNRINGFLNNTLIAPEKIINVSAEDHSTNHGQAYDAYLYQLQDIIEIYDLNEIIFCSKDLSSAEIIRQMSSLNDKQVDFKIAPPESLYIIGSNSIESSGEYYIIGSDTILKPVNQRNKRIFDWIFGLSLLIMSPILIWFLKNKAQFFANIFAVWSGQISWVGFDLDSSLNNQNLKIKRGVLSPSSRYQKSELKQETIEKLNFDYVRNYSVLTDLELVLNNIDKLGGSPST